MKQFGIICLISAFLISCGGADDSKLTAKTSLNKVLVIPTTAVSCLALKMAASGVQPDMDIGSAYFRIPKLTFTKKNKDNTMYIVLVKITADIPEAPLECVIGGDSLAALSSTWWSATSRDTSIAAGTESLTTDCALYCGGLSTKLIYTSTATLTVIGYEQAPGSDLQEPVKAQTTFQIENPL